ncbi:hypothetical protein [Gordonia sp. (in: high G+C Gram-positive bacteria)]|uniref:hypothetical protein n=1 Tax=Gordonia sp. (in: high G+C Gram-positive bacteria) TaxID=84139 RepID=UPI003528EF42
MTIVSAGDLALLMVILVTLALVLGTCVLSVRRHLRHSGVLGRRAPDGRDGLGTDLRGLGDTRLNPGPSRSSDVESRRNSGAGTYHAATSRCSGRRN